MQTDMVFRGRTWVFGDNISTDLIMPSAITFGLAKSTEARKKATMPNRPGWAENEVKPGDIIAARRNFGCGSSRPAPRVLAEDLGVATVVADSFARVFQRNAVNIGFPTLVCPGICDVVDEGDVIEVDIDAGLVTNITRGGTILGTAFPPDSPPGQILRMGGLRAYLEKWVTEHPESRQPFGESKARCAR